MPRYVLAFAVAASAVLVAPAARAWQEAHQTGDDVTVRVDAAGMADVEHHVRWHVVRGPLKSIDIVNVDPTATVNPDVTVVTESGKAVTAHAARHDASSVRVTIDDPRLVMRGNFEFGVTWHVDLAAARALSRDGATWRLTWSAPVAVDGFDAARTTFELPAAPDAPVAIVADTGAVDDAIVSSLRRDEGVDHLELVRPHVARGEAPVWTLRVDPRALGLVSDPTLRPPSENAAAPEPDRSREVLAGAGLLAVALLFAFLVARRARSLTAGGGSGARGLVPLPPLVRALAGGAALAAAIPLQLAGWTMMGAGLVAVAALFAAHRAPRCQSRARGPGRWLVLQPDEAFATGRRSWLGPALAWGAGVAALVGATLAAQAYSPDAPWLLNIDALALLPLALTGRIAHAGPDAVSGASGWLRRLFGRLSRHPALRARPWARVPVDARTPDELRLLVLPKAAIPGVVGVEVGMAWSQTPTGWAPAPEVLARFLDGTPAASRFARAVPGVRSVPGRRPEERVVRLPSRRASTRHAEGLVRALADLFTDRRAEAAAWEGADRRAPIVRTSPASTLVAAPNPG